MQCTQCGSQVGEGERFCPFCHAPVPKLYRNSQFHGLVPPQDGAEGGPPSDNRPAEDGLVILSVLIPFLGLIIGAICLGGTEKRAGRTYILLSVVNLALCAGLIMLFFVLPLIVFGGGGR